MANGKNSQVVSVSMPRALMRDVEKLRARYFRKRSEVFQDAVRQYVARHRRVKYGSPEYWAAADAAVPADDEPYTRSQRAASRRAEAEIKSGAYVTLEQFVAKHGHVAPRRSAKR